VTNPSGNFNEVTGVTDREEHVFDTGNVTGLWTWHWENVWTENNVHLWVPEASPVTYEIFSAPSRPLPVSSARPLAFWQTNTVELGRLIPITLGEGTQRIVVGDVQRARDILSGDLALVESGHPGKALVCHVPDGDKSRVRLLLVGASAVPGLVAQGGSVDESAAMGALLSQLLAVKLNIAAAAELGESLPDALVYASTESVADVVARSDALVVTGTNLCSVDASVLSEIVRLTRLLDAINDAEVSYHLFSPVAPATITPSRKAPSLPQVGPAPNVTR